VTAQSDRYWETRKSLLIPVCRWLGSQLRDCSWFDRNHVIQSPSESNQQDMEQEIYH